METERFDLVEVRLLVLRVEVEGAKARESPAGSKFLARDIRVDAVHLVRGRRHRKDDVVVHARRAPALHQPVFRAVIRVKGQVAVEVADAPDRFPGNGVRVDVAVRVDQMFHVSFSFYGAIYAVSMEASA